jgi:hypothetical protein
MTRVQAPLSEGVGYTFPSRNPAHSDPEWFQCDLDDQWEDPDTEPADPLPTERHRTVPGFPAGGN